MDGPVPGAGTLINVVAVTAGALIGILAGNRLPDRVRDVVTSCLGLVTLLMAILSALDVTAPELEAAVGRGAPILVVLAALLLGGIVGAYLRIEERLESLAGVVQRQVGRLVRDRGAAHGSAHEARERFIEGWLTASLLFCVGPLTILGSLSDGLGRGIDQLVLKSALDFFAAIAFASTFGIGVLLSAVSVAVVQGTLTLVGVTLGSVVPDAHVAALTATGGLLLVGIAFRLLGIKQVPVGDLLPALLLAPLLVSLVSALR